MKLHFVIWVAVATGLAGCKDHELQKLTAVRDEVCGCKTVKCAETALTRVPKENVKSTSRSQRLAREMLDCLADLYELDRPTLDPDAPLDPAVPPRP